MVIPFFPEGVAAETTATTPDLSRNVYLNS